MADITDITAVAFSNKRVRVAADRIAQSYYLCDSVQSQFAALGSNQAALDALESDIRNAAKRLRTAMDVSFESYRLWFAAGINVTITNSGSDQIIDGAPTDGRQTIFGDDCHNIVTQMGELQGWLNDGTWTFSLNGDWAEYDTVLQMEKSTLVLADVTNFMTRCTELRTQMEANANAKLNQLLEVAVNPLKD